LKEMTALISELTEMKPSFHDAIFGGSGGKDFSIDMSELVLTGHSFGGLTALTTASKHS